MQYIYCIMLNHGTPSSVDSCAVNIYTAAGKPVQTINLDGEFAYASFAFNGQFIALEHNGEIWLMDKTGHFLQRFSSGVSSEEGASIFLYRDELLLANYDTGEVQRFQLP